MKVLRQLHAAARNAFVWLSAVVCASSCTPPSGPASPNAGSQEAPPPNANTFDASPSAAAAGVSPPAPTTPSDVLQNGRGPFDACYERARVADPQLGRTWIEITFDIDSTGAARTVDLHYRNRMDDAAKECMRDAALALRFPPSMSGKRMGKIAFPPAPPASR